MRGQLQLEALIAFTIFLAVMGILIASASQISDESKRSASQAHASAYSLHQSLRLSIFGFSGQGPPPLGECSAAASAIVCEFENRSASAPTTLGTFYGAIYDTSVRIYEATTPIPL